MRLPIVFWKKNCPVSWLICGLITLSSKFFSMRRAFLIGIFCLCGYSLRSGLMFSENMSCLGDGLSLSLVFFPLPLREIESRYDLPLDCEFWFSRKCFFYDILLKGGLFVDTDPKLCKLVLRVSVVPVCLSGEMFLDSFVLLNFCLIESRSLNVIWRPIWEDSVEFIVPCISVAS